MATKHTFTAMLTDDGGFEIPFDVRATYGQARAPVKMTICGETYPTRVMVYDGKYMLGIWKAVLAKHALRGGQPIEVTLAPDNEERTIEPPAELAAALKQNAAARTGWAAMSFTHQREWARAIADAKKPETRERRVAQAIAALVAKAKQARAAKPKSAARTSAKPRGKSRAR
jgi:hypothetical protein